MRGSSKILMALIAVIILAAPFAKAEDELCLPTDKTAGSTYKVVIFDNVIYRIVSDIPCEMLFCKVDTNHHSVTIKPADDKATVTPFCEVSVQWGCFPPLSLGLEIGGSNSWLLGTETGYAEK